MLERLVWVVLLAALSGLVIAGLRLAGARLRSSFVGRRVLLSPPSGAGNGAVGTILYFSGPDCVDCKWRQEPALRELQERHSGLLTVVALDALTERDLARQFRVLTLPTTVVLDQQQRVRAVNYGYAPAVQLEQQLALA